MTYRIFCPVPRWPLGRGMQLVGGVEITELPANIKNEFKRWKSELTGNQIKALEATEFWFLRQFEDERILLEINTETHYRSVLSAMYAFQLIAPIGAPNFVIFSGREQNRLAIDSMRVFPALSSTRWAGACGFQGATRSEFVVLADGVNTALNGSTVRLKNALFLLEHGMRASAPYLPLLFWTTGLDALMMAINSDTFQQRLSNFLGANRLVLPAISTIGQPKCRVHEVLGDLFELRSIIAHGRRVEDKFLERCGLRMLDDRPREIQEVDSCRYSQVLEECALFLLCRTLRRIFGEHLAETVGNEKQWKAILNSAS